MVKTVMMERKKNVMWDLKFVVMKITILRYLRIIYQRYLLHPQGILKPGKNIAHLY
jgi:hypothetical protein